LFLEGLPKPERWRRLRNIESRESKEACNV
ncbi:unnamed protein product, partial [marine sediment metagenome]